MILSIKQHESIHQRLLMLFSFVLPIHPRFASLCVILLGINWLSSNAIIRNFKTLLQPIPILFIGFYIIHLLGMIHTSNLMEGWQKLETKLPFLIFPLILFTFPIKKEEQYLKIFKSFVLGCLLASVYSFAFALRQTYLTGVNWLFYSRLSSFLEIHTTYFGIYISVSLFFVLFFLVKNFSQKSSALKIGNIILAVWFFLFIFFLASRMVLLVTPIILGIAFLIWMKSQHRLSIGIGIVFFTTILLGVFIMSQPKIKNKLKPTYKKLENKVVVQRSNYVRIEIWDSAISLAKENFFIGTGTGDTQNELQKIYIEKEFKLGVLKKYNPHNQYLQTTATLGFLGGLILLLFLFYPLVLAIKQKDYLYIYLLSIMILIMLTESILQRQHGTLFFGFFHTLFMVRSLSENKKERYSSVPL